MLTLEFGRNKHKTIKNAAEEAGFDELDVILQRAK